MKIGPVSARLDFGSATLRKIQHCQPFKRQRYWNRLICGEQRQHHVAVGKVMLKYMVGHSPR